MEQFLAVLPERFRRELRHLPYSLDDLVEIVADLGRQPQARYHEHVCDLGSQVVSYGDLQAVVSHLGQFGKDNRAGLAATLHRISAIRNRSGKIVGLTARVGRAVYGVVDVIRDVISQGRSVLLLGCPGVGKTTVLRESARVLADEFHKRVVVVDTSNEIAGDADIPHTGIGRARRLQVPEPSLQHAVMIEAVENHMPEVVVIDEIGTEAETYAARTIAERGVRLIATAHGSKLENLLMNPTLCDLVGGIESVTLSDEEAKRRRSRKAVLERKALPTFDVIVEIRDRFTFAVHQDVASVVDACLRGRTPEPEVRVRDRDGVVHVTLPRVLPEVVDEPSHDSAFAAAADWEADSMGSEDYALAPPPPGSLVKEGARIFPYAISRNRLQMAIDTVGAPAVVAQSWSEGDFVLTLRGKDKKQSLVFDRIRARRIPVHLIRANTTAQIQAFLEQYFNTPQATPGQLAMREAQSAVEQVKKCGLPQNLAPQELKLRRMQHKLVENAGLAARSCGVEPSRYVRVFLQSEASVDQESEHY